MSSAESFPGEAAFRESVPAKYRYLLDPEWKPDRRTSAEEMALHKAIQTSRTRAAEAAKFEEQMRAIKRGLDDARNARSVALRSLQKRDAQAIGEKAATIGVDEALLETLEQSGITGAVLRNLLTTLKSQNIDVHSLVKQEAADKPSA